MDSIKKRIKNKLPRWLQDANETRKLVPRFLRAEVQEWKVGMEPVAFYTDRETVDRIVEDRMSLSRFGDGEFRWMLERSEQSFQECSAQLAHALLEAFQNRNPNLMIGIPLGMFDSSGCKLYVRMWWRIIKWDTFARLTPYMDYGKKYCNASITRPYIDYVDRDYSRQCFENIRRIWDGRDCVFVEGEQTKLGLGNDLFDNAKTIGRILCPAENAFEKLEEIKDAIRTHGTKDTLLLGALGPTASVLAAQMCEEGYQFVDIGHVDIEYIWFLRKAKRREPVEGKYVNECGRQVLPGSCENEAYKKSILTVVR